MVSWTPQVRRHGIWGDQARTSLLGAHLNTPTDAAAVTSIDTLFGANRTSQATCGFLVLGISSSAPDRDLWLE